MNQNNTHIVSRITAFLVLCVFLLPAIVNTIHATEGHQHYDTCAASDTHVHASKLDCELGDLQMVEYGVYAFAKAYSFHSPIIPTLQTQYAQKDYVYTVLTLSNKGPPSC